MGRIYFNERTGEFWESHRRSRTPPEGFKYAGVTIYYRRRVKVRWYGYKYFCPKCGVYHPFIVKFRNFLAVHERRLLEYGAKYGCDEAKRLLRVGRLIGGRSVHYDMVEKVRERGLLDWLESRIDLPNELLRKAVRRLARGDTLEDVEAWIIASLIKR